MNRLRRIDRWIGCRMSAGRWIAVYTLVACGGIVLFSQGWWAILGAFMLYISIVGIVTNARRLNEE